MCGHCGCEGGGATVVAADGTHTHVMPDGSVVTHAHDHAQAHDHEHGHEHSHEHSHEHERSHEHRGEVIQLAARVMEKNDRLAERNRAFFLGRELTVVNLMSSPGAGKTALLVRTLKELGSDVAVLEGDQETSRDAERIRETGAPVVQINTGTGCHLEADMVWRGLEQLDPAAGATLFIENVGNLVCPALFDLGEDARVVLFSVTEGEDKPLKYPHMFRRADLVLMTKVDLLPHLDFELDRALAAVSHIAPDAAVLQVSAKTGVGLDAWYAWLNADRRRSRTE